MAHTQEKKKSGTIANRRTPRRSHERLVGVLYAGKYSLLKSHQMSEGGMMLDLPIDIAEGEHILVTLLIPKNMNHLISQAEVLYRTDKGENGVSKAGIRFIALEPAKKRLIRDYVSSKSNTDVLEAFEHKSFAAEKAEQYAQKSLQNLKSNFKKEKPELVHSGVISESFKKIS